MNGNARTQASRRGTADSGVSSEARGWDVGGRVEVRDAAGVDTVEVYATHGSNAGGSREVHVATITKDAAGGLKIHHRI